MNQQSPNVYNEKDKYKKPPKQHQEEVRPQTVNEIAPIHIHTNVEIPLYTPSYLSKIIIR